jgi:hypothetical protein
MKSCAGRTRFAKERPLIIAEVHHQGAAEQITAWLTEHQYCAQWNIPNEKFPRIFLPGPQRQIDRPGCGIVGEGQHESGRRLTLESDD